MQAFSNLGNQNFVIAFGLSKTFIIGSKNSEKV